MIDNLFLVKSYLISWGGTHEGLRLTQHANIVRLAVNSFLLILLSSLLLLSCPLYAKNPNEVILCTWNIGHFSNGAKSYSLIDVSKYKESLVDYYSFIYNEIMPDVITINEYNRVFCGEDNDNSPYKTSSLLFNGFKHNAIGPQCWGICNAVFSNLKMRKTRPIYFESQKNTDGDDVVKSRENYYYESDLYIQGKKVKLVLFHLLFSNKVEEVYQQRQIQELIKRYSTTERVILCGDWNTETYTALMDAGYELANDGLLKTFPGNAEALDNVAVKGLKIIDVRMIKTSLSDHYPLICRLSLK